jgi:hypothetical protein
MYLPYLVAAKCGNNDVAQNLGIRFDITVMQDGKATAVRILDSTIDNPWLSKDVIRRIYSIKFTGLHQKEFSGVVEASLSLADATKRMKIYPSMCKNVYTYNLRPGRDPYGIMAIAVPDNWYDNTDEYLTKINSISTSNRVSPDPGIKSLLMVNRGNGSGSCKFRELRYLPKENGYHWGIERLATEVAQVRNKVLRDYKVKDYLQAGVSVPLDIKNAKRTERISSSKLKLNRYSAWETTYMHWFDETGSRKENAKTMTVVIKNGPETKLSTPKYYVVAECSAEGNETDIETTEKEIFSIMNTISLGGDIPVTHDFPTRK